MEITFKQRSFDLEFEDDHIELLTPKEFIRKQMLEIIHHQCKNNCFGNEGVKEWIEENASIFRECWRPFIFPEERMITLARKEIARHRWLESEKHGQDMGVEAEIDWINRFSKEFIEYWKSQL